jgi:hypothetical protein
MMPIIVTDQAPVSPPPYHRAQARRRSSLHLNALALVQTLHLLTCADWRSSWHIGVARRPCPKGQAAVRAPTARNPCC